MTQFLFSSSNHFSASISHFVCLACFLQINAISATPDNKSLPSHTSFLIETSRIVVLRIVTPGSVEDTALSCATLGPDPFPSRRLSWLEPLRFPHVVTAWSVWFPQCLFDMWQWRRGYLHTTTTTSTRTPTSNPLLSCSPSRLAVPGHYMSWLPWAGNFMQAVGEAAQ